MAQQLTGSLLLDSEFYPPFEGFPLAGVQFLRRLKKNNNRPWFERHRGEYESLVKMPMQSLIVALQSHFEKFAPEFDVHPKRSLFRIYRDTRFSKDKRPYKTHVAAHFVLRGKPKGYIGFGYYIHIEPGMIYIGGGIYMPESDQLKRIRQAITERAEEFLSLVSDRTFKRMFGGIEGEKLKRIPKGFEEDHPMAEWLRHKQFWVGVEWPEQRCYSSNLAKEAAKVFERATPFVRFLNS